MIVKITIPIELIEIFTNGNNEERESIADFICQAIYDSLCEELTDGEN